MMSLTDILSGSFTAHERIFYALAPGAVLTAYFLLGLPLYGIRCLRKGRFRDAELENRERTPLTALWARLYFAWVTRPLWLLVAKAQIPATAITTLSILLSLASGVALSSGRFSLGGWLFIFSGICDFLDGRIARHRKEASASGNLLDSTLDRYSDAAIFIGLAWYYRDNWILLPTLAALVGSQLVSYVRAKGESLGIQIRMGLMQRAERILLLGVTIALSPVLEAFVVPNDPSPVHRLAVMGVVIVAITTNVTAARRLVYGLGKLGPRPLRGWLSVSKGSLLRNVFSAVVATGADFALYFALVTHGEITPWLATLLGCALGAVVNFSMNRIWTFGSSESPLPQAMRYAFVSATSAMLNAGGVAVLLLIPANEFRMAWVVARCAVFLTWNFPLHRDYVFKASTDNERAGHQPEAR